MKISASLFQYALLKNGKLLADGVNKVSVVDMQHVRRDAVKGGRIILTTSGMLTGGPVLNYITQLSAGKYGKIEVIEKGEGGASGSSEPEGNFGSDSEEF